MSFLLSYYMGEPPSHLTGPAVSCFHNFSFRFLGSEMTELAEKLNFDREVIRVWFCNKRQTLKNTIKKLKSPQSPNS